MTCITELKNEIARLQEALEDEQRLYEYKRDEVKRLRAEIARLRRR